MLYIFPDELATYAPRVNVTAADEMAVVYYATEAVNSFLGRTLAYETFRSRARLSAGMVGYVRPLPIIEPVELRVRRMPRLAGGGHLANPHGWSSFATGSDIDQYIDTMTGRIELSGGEIESDYGRRSVAASRVRGSYEVELTYLSGWLASTQIRATNEDDATVLEVTDGSKFVPGTFLTIGLTPTLYEIVFASDSQIKLAEPVAVAPAVGDQVLTQVPADVKLACGIIIEDHQTYLPNALRQSRKLSVITDGARRLTGDTIPPPAQMLLAKYHEERFS